jgi:hypothetical protein
MHIVRASRQYPYILAPLGLSTKTVTLRHVDNRALGHVAANGDEHDADTLFVQVENSLLVVLVVVNAVFEHVSSVPSQLIERYVLIHMLECILKTIITPVAALSPTLVCLPIEKLPTHDTVVENGERVQLAVVTPLCS